MDGGIQSSTLRSYFSTIKHILKQDGYEWNDKKMLLNTLVKGCKLENDRVKIRLPIQKGLLEMLLFEVQRYYSERRTQLYLDSMYKAMFCLGYYGMLRVGEVTVSPHNIKAKDVHVGNNKDKIQLVLYSSKTHGKESRPQKIKISAVPNKDGTIPEKFFCPFKAVIKYMSIRGAYIDNQEPFFIFADRSAVKADQVRTLLRKLLDNLNLDAVLYDVYSFRIGRTCDLEKFWYSVDQIKAMGRWNPMQYTDT